MLSVGKSKAAAAAELLREQDALIRQREKVGTCITGPRYTRRPWTG